MIRAIPQTQLKNLFKVRNHIILLNRVQAFARKYTDIPINANSHYVKYTSKKSMYEMLKSDSLFMFCSELSNDKTENKMLHIDKPSDTYISCFYNNNPSFSTPLRNSSDIFSQWMSYCPDGGASFEFYFGQDFFGKINSIDKSKPKEYDDAIDEFFSDMDIINKRQFLYSLVTNNASNDSDYILYPNFPFQVQYYENTINDVDSIASTFKQLVKDYKLRESYIVPYLKHSGFIQESEARLAFVNENNCLSNCIKFMESGDGTMIPYIEVKFGDTDLLNSPCNFVEQQEDETLEGAVERHLKARNASNILRNNAKIPIIIPQGRDQEDVYNVVERVLDELSKGRSQQNKPKIICQGHLPITKITLAPTEDRTEQKKKMEIFCKSKYWMRNVEIVESTIPYNTKNSNHI